MFNQRRGLQHWIFKRMEVRGLRRIYPVSLRGNASRLMLLLVFLLINPPDFSFLPSRTHKRHIKSALIGCFCSCCTMLLMKGLSVRKGQLRASRRRRSNCRLEESKTLLARSRYARPPARPLLQHLGWKCGEIAPADPPAAPSASEIKGVNPNLPPKDLCGWEERDRDVWG